MHENRHHMIVHSRNPTMATQTIASETPSSEAPGAAAHVGPRKRLGVLIVAENASIRRAASSSLAIHWFLGLLKEDVDVHLLVHVRSKPELDQSLSRFASRIHYVPDVLLQKICWKLGEALPDHVRNFTSGWRCTWSRSSCSGARPGG